MAAASAWKMPAPDKSRLALDKNAGQLGLLGDVEEVKSAGQYHYFTGKFATRSEAEKMLPELFNLGFRTAKIEQSTPQAN